MNWLEFSFLVNYDIVFEYKSTYYNIVFEDSEVILYKAPGVRLASEAIEEKNKILEYQFDGKLSLEEVLLSNGVKLIDFIEET